MTPKDLWCSLQLPEYVLDHLHLSNGDPAVPSSFKLGSAAQTAVGLSALSASYLHFLRSGKQQEVYVDARHAVLDFHSEAWYTVDGEGLPKDVWDSIAGLYRTKNRSWVRIHTNFPHHRKGILDLLQLSDDAPSGPVTRDQVQEALLNWDSIQFETAAAAVGMCATALRSFAEWESTPQAQALRGVPPVQVLKIADSNPRNNTGITARPLEGIRVLDLSRVLAGPVSGRTLAGHGATVLLVTSPDLPALPVLDIDTSRGKLTTQLDLKNPADKSRLDSLISDADVFLQAYRPGALAKKGFSPQDVSSIKPAIVYASISAWGWEGDWKDRRGFDSLVQTATGFNMDEAQAYAIFTARDPNSPDLQPRPLPMQALDHAAGHMLAFGINAALCRTITEGGSYEVRVSLAAVGQWIRSLGRLDPQEAFGENARPMPPRTIPPSEEIQPLLEIWHESAPSENQSPRTMHALAHSAILSETPFRVGDAPMTLNKHPAAWP